MEPYNCRSQLKTAVVDITSLYCFNWMKEGWKEIVLFNDVFNTFYLRLYGVEYMVKDRGYS